MIFAIQNKINLTIFSFQHYTSFFKIVGGTLSRSFIDCSSNIFSFEENSIYIEERDCIEEKKERDRFCLSLLAVRFSCARCDNEKFHSLDIVSFLFPLTFANKFYRYSRVSIILSTNNKVIF